MKNKIRPIIGWIAALIVGAFNIFATIAKFMPVEPGSQAEEFTQRLGMTGLEHQLGVLEGIIVVLFLIPRTSTVGLVLTVGYLGGALATNLTHGFSSLEALPLYIGLVLVAISAWGRNPELLSRMLGHPVATNMKTRLQKVLGWAPVILVSAFLIVASGLPKLFMSSEGSALQELATALGTWEIQIYIGILEIFCAVLILIPRFSTVGFILMTGLLGGATATSLTHPEVEGVWPWFPFALLLLLTLSAYFRSPELLSRLQKKPVA